MQQYFSNECQDTVEKVTALQADGCFSFCLIADSHVSPLLPESVPRQYHSFENLKAVNAQTKFHGIFHLGDILWLNGNPATPAYWTEENLDHWFDITKDNLFAANPNTYFIAGNHDEILAQSPNRARWHRKMVAFQKNKISGYVPEEPYYYVDFPETKIRAVCMMSNYGDSTGNHTGIYREQMEWFASDALLAPDGWNILLFTHVPPVKVKGIRDAGQDNLEEFAGFLWAFARKEHFESPVFSGDFRQTGSAKIAAMFVGDSHVDWILEPGILPFPVIELGANHVHMPHRESDWPMPKGSSAPDRAYDTVTEDLWDAVVFNPGAHTIDLIRFGAGEDRHVDLSAYRIP